MQGPGPIWTRSPKRGWVRDKVQQTVRSVQTTPNVIVSLETHCCKLIKANVAPSQRLLLSCALVAIQCRRLKGLVCRRAHFRGGQEHEKNQAAKRPNHFGEPRALVGFRLSSEPILALTWTVTLHRFIGFERRCSPSRLPSVTLCPTKGGA